MQRNFEIGQSNELLHKGNNYDLHNRFDFGSLTISSGRGLVLVLHPHAEYGKGLPTIRIEGVDIDFLELSEGLGTRHLPGIEEIGYKRPDDADLDWLMGEKHARAADHLVLRFSGEDYVRLHAREVSLEECGAFRCQPNRGE